MVEKGLLYTKEHEWIKVDGDTGTVGISDHAQELLGDITFVELPELEANCAQKEQIAVVESSKAASDVYAPVSGRVVAVNKALEDKPEWVNESCYNQGWLYKVTIKDMKETEGLMDAPAYETFLSELDD